MKLTPRLKAIAAMVPKGSVIADIGTDHGYIPVSLIKNGTVQRAIASDVRKGPLNRAKYVIQRHGLPGDIETLLGDGLEVLKNEAVDVVVLAGMGGVLIRDILERGKGLLQDTKRLILQPMNAQEAVREWLSLNEYEIVDETLAREGEKIYQIIVAEPGGNVPLDPFYFEISKKLIEKNHPLLPDLLESKEKEYKKIIKGLRASGQAEATKKLKEYTERLIRLQGVIDQCRNQRT